MTVPACARRVIPPRRRAACESTLRITPYEYHQTRTVVTGLLESEAEEEILSDPETGGLPVPVQVLLLRYCPSKSSCKDVSVPWT